MHAVSLGDGLEVLARDGYVLLTEQPGRADDLEQATRRLADQTKRDRDAQRAARQQRQSANR